MFRSVLKIVGLLSIVVGLSLAQSVPSYVVRTFAGSFPLGDGGPATAALLHLPYSAIYDSAGNLFIADNSSIRKVTPDGVISTFSAGSAFALAFGRDGNLYSGSFNGVYRHSAAGARTIFAGTGVSGFSGDGGPATAAQMGNGTGIAFDADGRLFLTDGHRVRRVGLDGVINTIAGTGTGGLVATAARRLPPCFSPPPGSR